MRLLGRVTCPLLLIMVVAGCAQTTVTDQQTYQGARLARPDRIIVYDFAASAADLPPGYNMAVSAPNLPQSVDERGQGQKLGAEIAKELVSQLQAAGLPAVQASTQNPPRLGDITIVGYFVSVDSGNMAKRFAIGFGSGAADLKTAVEVYLMSRQGLRRLGAEELNSEGPKGPGEALPLAVTLASSNPIGLIVSSAAHVEGEVSGRTTVEGSAKRTAKEIGDKLIAAAQRQGWI